MNFWPKRYKKTTIEKFCLSGTTIEFVGDFTYLGHMITCDLRDELDMGEQLRKFNTLGNVIIRKFVQCEDAVRSKLFQALWSAIYCSSLWCSYKVATLRKVRVCHYDILRRIMGYPRWSSAATLSVNLELNCLVVVLQKRYYSLKKRLQYGYYPIVSAIFSSNSFKNSIWYSRWQNSVDVVCKEFFCS